RLSLRAQRDHSTHLYVEEVLKAYGFTLADVEAWGGRITYEVGTPAEPARMNKLRAGEIDAIFDEALNRFIPPAVEAGWRFLPLEEPILQQMDDLGFRRATLPKAKYPM